MKNLWKWFWRNFDAIAAVAALILIFPIGTGMLSLDAFDQSLLLLLLAYEWFRTWLNERGQTP